MDTQTLETQKRIAISLTASLKKQPRLNFFKRGCFLIFELFRTKILAQLDSVFF
jgi:hypothetical protein